MQRKNVPALESATESLPNPGDFPLGSLESRAAARARLIASENALVGVAVDESRRNESPEEWERRNAWRRQRVLQEAIERQK